ncbi:MAG: hypothetical protein SPD11_04435 [Sphaerochaetaceae bacterium]|nr:hypothetical protein [Sphaerochaetaceae bacterium]
MELTKKTVAILMVLAVAGALWAAVDLSQADTLYVMDKPAECKAELEKQLAKAASASERSDVLWRLARVQVTIGDDLDKNDKDGRFAAYELGQEYAEQSIAEKPSAMGYLWKASNIGRWGQTKGPLNSLSKAKPMLSDLRILVDDLNCLDSSEAWYVLASLYDQLPGKPISFGDSQYAISFARAAVDTIPSEVIYPGTYQALAEMLWKRNWNMSKRVAEITKKQDKWDKGGGTNFDKYIHYEGKGGPSAQPFYSSVPLSRMSDRQEAVMLLLYAKAVYDSRSFHSRADQRNIVEIQELTAKWYAELAK